MKRPFPIPPLDPSKIAVKVGEQTLRPVGVHVTGSEDGIPTPGVKPQFDAMNPRPPHVTQPVPQQFYQWAQNVPINADAFAALIQAQSPGVYWEKAAQCPSRLKNGDHDPTCMICDHGILFFEKIECAMLVTSTTLQQNYYIQGRLDSGSVLVTSLPANPISYLDRITVKANFVRDSELRQRTQGTFVDPLKFPALEVHLLRTKDRTFVCGSDFNINKDGLIEWSKTMAARPRTGEWYTIVYSHYPVYIITEMLHHHRDRLVKQLTDKQQAVRLPIQGLAKLYQLVRNEGKDAPAVTYSNPFDGT